MRCRRKAGGEPLGALAAFVVAAAPTVLSSTPLVAGASVHVEQASAYGQTKASRLGLVVPVYDGDVDRSISALALWPTVCSEETLSSVDLILYKAESENEETSALLSDRLQETAGRCFANSKVVYADLEQEDNVYPKGPSLQFYKLFLDDDVRQHVIGYDALAIIEWDVLVARDTSFQQLYHAAFDAPEPFWVKGSVVAGTNFHSAASNSDMWHVLGHINGNAIYNNNDPDFVEFVAYALARWEYEYPYDVALWATISDFPYSWPLWQRYSSKFVTTNLIANVGYENVDANAVSTAVAGETLFIHGSSVEGGSRAVPFVGRSSVHTTPEDMVTCEDSCGNAAGIPAGVSTVCDPSCDMGKRFDGHLCGAGDHEKYGSSCRLCFTDRVAALKAEEVLRLTEPLEGVAKHVIMCDTMRPPEALECDAKCALKTDTVCDARCGTGHYGDYNCNWRDHGVSCRYCFDDVEAALVSDEVAKRHGGRVVMCDTHEPPARVGEVINVASASRQLTSSKKGKDDDDDGIPKWKKTMKWKNPNGDPKWRQAKKWKDDGKDSGVEPKWKRNEKWRKDDGKDNDVEPKWKRNEKWKKKGKKGKKSVKKDNKKSENKKGKKDNKKKGNKDNKKKDKKDGGGRPRPAPTPAPVQAPSPIALTCDDRCEVTNESTGRGRVCDSSCSDSHPVYGTRGCGAGGGRFGEECRRCFTDVEVARAADRPNGRVILCETLAPPDVYDRRRLSTVIDEMFVDAEPAGEDLSRRLTSSKKGKDDDDDGIPKWKKTMKWKNPDGEPKWRQAKKWKKDEKDSGVEPKWKRNEKWRKDDGKGNDVEPKWKRNEKWKKKGKKGKKSVKKDNKKTKKNKGKKDNKKKDNKKKDKKDNKKGGGGRPRPAPTPAPVPAPSPTRPTCDDRCEVTNESTGRGRVCDSSCSDSHPVYGTRGCGAGGGRFGEECRRCFTDVEVARAADRPNGRVILCETLAPPDVYDRRRLSTVIDEMFVDAEPAGEDLSRRLTSSKKGKDDDDDGIPKWKKSMKWKNPDGEPKWRQAKKWKKDEKDSGVEPKWKRNEKWRKDDGKDNDVEPKWKRNEKWKKKGKKGKKSVKKDNKKTKKNKKGKKDNKKKDKKDNKKGGGGRPRPAPTPAPVPAPSPTRPVCDDRCEVTNESTGRGRVCDSSCSDSHPVYGTRGCGAGGGRFGEECRRCFTDVEVARAADRPNGRVILCETLAPPDVYDRRLTGTALNLFTEDSADSSSDESGDVDLSDSKDSSDSSDSEDSDSVDSEDSQHDASSAPGVGGGDLCAFVSSSSALLAETEVTVASVLEFMPGMRIAVAVDADDVNAFESTFEALPSVTISETSNAPVAAILADRYCGDDAELIYYLSPGTLVSRSFTSKDTHSPRGDLLVVYSDGRGADRATIASADATTSLLGFEAPVFTYGTDLILPSFVNGELREELMPDVHPNHENEKVLGVVADVRNVNAVEVLAAFAYSRNFEGMWFLNPQRWVTQHLFKAASIWDIPLVKPRFSCSLDPSIQLEAVDLSTELTRQLDAFSNGATCESGVLSIDTRNLRQLE